MALLFLQRLISSFLLKFKCLLKKKALIVLMIFILTSFIAGLIWLTISLSLVFLSYKLIRYFSNWIRHTLVKTIVQHFIFYLYIFLIGVGIKLFILELYKIPSISMQNTLLPNDIIIVNKLAFGPKLFNSSYEKAGRKSLKILSI
jgi:signal peptidase I